VAIGRRRSKGRISRRRSGSLSSAGLHTDTAAAGVSAEVTIARDLNKPYFLLAWIQGQDKQESPELRFLRGGTRLYKWDLGQFEGRSSAGPTAKALA